MRVSYTCQKDEKYVDFNTMPNRIQVSLNEVGGAVNLDMSL